MSKIQFSLLASVKTVYSFGYIKVGETLRVL